MDDAAPVEIDRFLVGYAEEFDIGAVDEGAFAVEPGDPHGNRRGIGDQAEAVFAFAQRFRGQAAFGDVDEGADRPLQFAIPQHRADPVFDREGRAVDPVEQFVRDMGGLAGLGADIDRAIVDIVGRPVRVGVVDDIVQLAAQHLGSGGETQHAQEYGVAQAGGAVPLDSVEAVDGIIEH